MASPNELSLEEMLKYLLDNGGFVKNQDLVKHFKTFLIQPDTRVIARNKFKEYINTLATIKTKDGEKYLELKRKFRQPSLDISSPTLSFAQFPSAPSTSYQSPSSPLREPPPYRLPPSPISGPSASGLSSITSPTRRYPPETYNANSPISEPISEECESNESFKFTSEEDSSKSVSSPPVPPRRKSQDKIKIDKSKESSSFEEKVKSEPETIMEDDSSTNQLTPAEQLSVRERMQRFNKMATETDLPARPSVSSPSNKKRTDKSAEEDDRASVASQLDGKSREWLVKSAQGDYQALAKLAAEDPRLTRVKEKRQVNEASNIESDKFNKSSSGKNDPKTSKKKYTYEKRFNCETCNKGFKFMYKLKAHVRLHTGERPFKCDICGYCFKNQSTLISHKTIHSDEKPYKCEICGMSCKRKYDLQVHKNTHKNPENRVRFECEICLKSFISKSSVLQHKKKAHSDERPYKCNICNKAFVLISELKQHLVMHSNFEPFKCEFCDKSFKRKISLTNHKKIHFVTQTQVSRQITTDTDVKKYKCHDCEKTFKIKNHLSEHIRGKHLEEKRHKCEDCGKCFFMLYRLKIHKLSHSEIKPYSCKTCNKPFKSKYNLKTHEKNHSIGKNFKCTECDKGFFNLKNLERHKNSHTGEKPFTCNICYKSYPRDDSLKRHKLIHYHPKLYTCNDCGITFELRKEIKKHLKVHKVQMKNYKCNLCGKVYTTSKYFKKHKSDHETKIIYNCDICDDKFYVKKLLQLHIKSHDKYDSRKSNEIPKNAANSEDKIFKCDRCEKSYHRKCNYTTHIKIHEKQDKQNENNSKNEFSSFCFIKTEKTDESFENSNEQFSDSISFTDEKVDVGILETLAIDPLFDVSQNIEVSSENLNDMDIKIEPNEFDS